MDTAAGEGALSALEGALLKGKKGGKKSAVKKAPAAGEWVEVDLTGLATEPPAPARSKKETSLVEQAKAKISSGELAPADVPGWILEQTGRKRDGKRVERIREQIAQGSPTTRIWDEDQMIPPTESSGRPIAPEDLGAPDLMQRKISPPASESDTRELRLSFPTLIREW